MHMEKALHGSWSLAIHCSWVKTERAADQFDTAKSQRTATCICFCSPCKALTMQNVLNIAGQTVQSKKADDYTSPSCWYIGLEADCVLHLVPFGKC